MLEHVTEDGRYQAVVGNHEDLAIQWYENEFLTWWQAGGFQSGRLMPESYFDFAKWIDAMDFLLPRKLEPIISFFKQLSFEKKISAAGLDYRIVHGWYAEEGLDEKSRRYKTIWMRCVGENADTDEVIVHGHTPTIDPSYNSTGVKPGLISYGENSINVDGGCCFAGYLPYPCMLCAICLETLDEIYPYTLKERFQMIARIPLSDEEACKIAKEYEKDFPEESEYRSRLLRRLESGYI